MDISTDNQGQKKSKIFSFLNNIIGGSEFEHESDDGIKSTEKKSKLAKYAESIEQSNYLSRDLSWLKFNERVLDQVQKQELNLFERLKFLAITSSNLDEFFTIRIGSLYNYLDYGKERVDYSGLREVPFKKALFGAIKQFYEEQNRLFTEELMPLFEQYKFKIFKCADLNENQLAEVTEYFDFTIYPMLTPMLYDHTHAFPILVAKTLIFGVVTDTQQSALFPNGSDDKKLSFVQIPNNLPRFYFISQGEDLLFIPIEDIVRHQIQKLYRNIAIESINLFRITRNGDFSLEESDDIEADFVDEIKQKIKSRRVGRVVRLEMEENPSKWMMKILSKRWEIDKDNIFYTNNLIDYTGLWQIIKHPEFLEASTPEHSPVQPLGITREKMSNIFEAIKERDICLHHPYNNFEPVIQLIERAAEDPDVLSIKLTIYRLAKKSRVTAALLKAAENGKHVSVLFEIKARFDEENNIREAEKLQKAGCFVIYGIGWFKTHTKLMLIVRKEGNKVVQYAHMASGNYNEDTSKLYTDIGILTARPSYTRDISEFFNVITGHSQPINYENLITSPRDMRRRLIELIQQEAANAKNGLPAGICIKINSLEDRELIDELYEASKQGVKIDLIVRGICCLRPNRVGLSENISVRSIVGHYLEHTRLYYFHNAGTPKIYGGSADIMVRSFDRRIESLFELVDPIIRQQAIHILSYNLKDNANAYQLLENGTYEHVQHTDSPFNIHKEFFKVTEEEIQNAKLMFNTNFE